MSVQMKGRRALSFFCFLPLEKLLPSLIKLYLQIEYIYTQSKYMYF